MPAGGEPAATSACFCLRRLRIARAPPITAAIPPAPISSHPQPGSPLDSAELLVAAAAPAAAAAPGWPGAGVEVVGLGVVTVDVWMTVVVCAGAVTVFVTVGAVTVFVTVGAVTVFVTVFVLVGAVTVSVLVAVVASAIVAVLLGGVVVVCGEVAFPPGDFPWSLTPGVLMVLPAPAVPALVRVTLPATLAAVPEPHPAKAAVRPPSSAAAAHRLARPTIAAQDGDATVLLITRFR